MNILLSTIGRRTYLTDYFRETVPGPVKIFGTTDRHSENTEFTIGLLYCDKGFLMPAVQHPAYINTLLDLCKSEKIDIITSLFDLDSREISNHTDKLHNIGTTPFISSQTVNNICFDKYKTFTFLKENSLTTPNTFITIDDFIKSGVSYPVIIKPRFGFASIGISTINNDEELLALFKKDTHIIQEFIQGQEYSFDIFNCLEGRVLSCVVKRKIKMRAGETDQAITVKNTKLIDLAIEVAETLGAVGPLDVDLFICGKEVYILELNPRFGGGYPLSHMAGANFPQLMVDIASGKQPTPTIGNYTENLIMVKGVQTHFLSSIKTPPSLTDLSNGTRQQ